MFLNELMNKKHMTRSELSRVSGVPESTLRDILNGKAQIDHCEAGAMLCLAESLGTTVEEILYAFWDEQLGFCETRQSARKPVHDPGSLVHFYMIADAAISDLKNHNELDFACTVCREDMIESFYSMSFYRAALFLLGLVDYIHRKHDLLPDSRFDAFRVVSLDRPVYSLKTLEEDDAEEFISAKAFAEEEAIPELAVFNIFMTEEDIHPDMD